MCGISGFFQLKYRKDSFEEKLNKSNQLLFHRGPDGGGCWTNPVAGLGHRRLSIIDTSNNGSQPMKDPSGRYTIVFNGEIFNYSELKQKFFPYKNDWHSQSDTEVLLNLFILQKENCLQQLSGFFAFAVYDELNQELFLARDRFGKKPLLYYKSEDLFVFASEMKALLAYNIPKEINYTALYQYLQLNYIPQPSSIIKNVQKVKPGHYLVINKTACIEKPYYSIPNNKSPKPYPPYSEATDHLVELMDASVRKRMISDVPLGAFLSGGIDSSVVVALASRYTDGLNTFSIGYKDNPFFDETYYANLVAKKYSTQHTVFSLANSDFLEHLDRILNSLDEPFADSSAIPVYILSHHTRKYVTVALSGDGGDEIFAGYNKHQAEWRIRQKGIMGLLVMLGSPLWKLLPKSRNNKWGNITRQLNRFAEGSQLTAKERYWRWAGFLDESKAMELLSPASQKKINKEAYGVQKEFLLRNLNGTDGLEDFLITDMELVLLSDMLVKVDLMSMANSLEVRSPFLDHEVVDFAFTLPTAYKVDGKMKKKLVQDAFRNSLPPQLYDRPKRGFEIPMLDWLRNELWGMINNDLLEENFIKQQGIFNPDAVQGLKAQLNSANPEDSHATIWALLVFQHWWKRHIEV